MMLFNGIKVEVEEASKDGKGAVVRFLEDCYIYADESHGYHFRVNDKAYVPIDRLKPLF